MPESDDRRERFARLWLDVLEADQPDSELLARFVEDPESLSARERADIEARRDEPRVADRLRVLEGFDAALAAAEQEPPLVRPVLEPRRARASARPGGWRSWLALGPLALAGAAAAALAIAIVLPDGSGPPVLKGPAVARAPRPSPEPQASASAREERARQAAPRVQQRPARPGIDPSRLAEMTAPQKHTEPEPPADPPRRPVPEPGPVFTARADAAGEPAPDAGPAPIFTAEARFAPETGAGEQAESLDELFDGEIEGAPMLVASAIDYATPSELIERPWARTYRSLAPPGAGSTGDGPQLRALVPEHVAFTVSASPSLFWSLSEPPRPGWRFLLELAPSERPDQAGEAELPAPGAPGVQRVRLADLDVVLEPGVEYVWTITVQPDPSDPTRDVSAQGWIRRVELARATREQLGDRPLSNGLVYADAGLWYDALGAVADAIALRPDLAAGREAYRRLLAGAGLTQYATQLPQP